MIFYINDCISSIFIRLAMMFTSNSDVYKRLKIARHIQKLHIEESNR